MLPGRAATASRRMRRPAWDQELLLVVEQDLSLGREAVYAKGLMKSSYDNFKINNSAILVIKISSKNDGHPRLRNTPAT